MNKVLKWFTRDSFILPVVAIVMGLILGGIVMLMVDITRLKHMVLCSKGIW